MLGVGEWQAPSWGHLPPHFLPVPLGYPGYLGRHHDWGWDQDSTEVRSGRMVALVVRCSFCFLFFVLFCLSMFLFSVILSDSFSVLLNCFVTFVPFFVLMLIISHLDLIICISGIAGMHATLGLEAVS